MMHESSIQPDQSAFASQPMPQAEVKLTRMPEVEAETRRLQRDTGVPCFDEGLNELLPRGAVASVEASAPAPYDPSTRECDRYLQHQAVLAECDTERLLEELKAANQNLQELRQKHASMPSKARPGERLALWWYLILLSIVAWVAAAVFFAVSAGTTFVQPAIAMLAPSGFDPLHELMLIGGFGALVSAGLVLPFPLAVWVSRGRIAWPFKLGMLVIDVGFAVALAVLRDGNGSHLVVVCVSVIEVAIILAIGLYSFQIGSHLALLEEQRHVRAASLSQIEVALHHRDALQTSLTEARASHKQAIERVAVREDVADRVLKVKALAETTARLAYATEAAAMVQEVSHLTGDHPLPELITQAEAALTSTSQL